MPQDAIPAAGPDRIYRDHLDTGDIKVQRCVSCAEHFFPPRVMCPECRSRDHVWVDVAGGGEIYSASVVRRKPERGGDYSIVIVDLDEGVRMMSTVTDAVPTEVAIRQRVQLGIGNLDGEKAVIVTTGAESGETL
ncbi:Zn-ribbon domain-containing OB-fold protein [Roseovarius sp.]|uniref:Zn-ribbon domain-containing OB-fold protein n=1 Tax=Roseovarius sp. TaxID=1486281 RepID=UPI003563AD8F